MDFVTDKVRQIAGFIIKSDRKALPAGVLISRPTPIAKASPMAKEGYRPIAPIGKL